MTGYRQRPLAQVAVIGKPIAIRMRLARGGWLVAVVLGYKYETARYSEPVIYSPACYLLFADPPT